MKMNLAKLWIPSACAALLLAGAVFQAEARTVRPSPDRAFEIAVIPDTQNYLSYRHQRIQGFPFDASEIFLGQMHYVRRNLRANGGQVAFVVSVGDVWEHPSLPIDPAHEARGFRRVDSPLLDSNWGPTEQVRTFEMPLARRGYGLIAGLTPFGVAPGNHDYDAFWTDANNPPKPEMKTPDDMGVLHVGGLDNFVAVFGSQSDFFRDKPWYVASHDRGADSAQVFEAGGYRFLNIALQFDPPNASLDWAKSVIARYPGTPTILTVHNFLDNQGRRFSPRVIDSHVIDPQDNTPEMVWQKLVAPNDQIFMVLSGHNAGQAFRIDDNNAGHKVYQIMADYQDRGQTLIEHGLKPGPFLGMGDGWMRMMRFDTSRAASLVTVRTYSTHYRAYSTDLPDYARWYKAKEKPHLSDVEFLKQDDFRFTMPDFIARFGTPGRKCRC